jgi:hypothetical protein
MAQIVKFLNEMVILTGLKQDTMKLIRACEKVEPVKKFVQCYDIIDLTLQIQEMYPKEFPALPECDQGALLDLRRISQELLVYHWIDLPHPDISHYTLKVNSLLQAFFVPREDFDLNELRL